MLEPAISFSMFVPVCRTFFTVFVCFLQIKLLYTAVVGNVTSLRPGRNTHHVELDLTYLTMSDTSGGNIKHQPSKYSWRGLWAQCHTECQWFWQHDYQLQSNKFTPLRKHILLVYVIFHKTVMPPKVGRSSLKK